jgi:hypothetical protein
VAAVGCIHGREQITSSRASDFAAGSKGVEPILSVRCRARGQ